MEMVAYCSREASEGGYVLYKRKPSTSSGLDESQESPRLVTSSVFVFFIKAALLIYSSNSHITILASSVIVLNEEGADNNDLSDSHSLYVTILVELVYNHHSGPKYIDYTVGGQHIVTLLKQPQSATFLQVLSLYNIIPPPVYWHEVFITLIIFYRLLIVIYTSSRRGRGS